MKNWNYQTTIIDVRWTDSILLMLYTDDSHRSRGEISELSRSRCVIQNKTRFTVHEEVKSTVKFTILRTNSWMRRDSLPSWRSAITCYATTVKTAEKTVSHNSAFQRKLKGQDLEHHWFVACCQNNHWSAEEQILCNYQKLCPNTRTSPCVIEGQSPIVTCDSLRKYLDIS